MNYAHTYELLTRVKEETQLVEAQFIYENKYNKLQKYKLYKEAFQEVIQPIINEVYREDFTDEESREYNFTINTLLEILVILAERKVITMNTIISMLIERTDEQDATKIADVILIGNHYKLWFLTKDRYTRLHCLYELSDELQQRIKEFRFLNPMLVQPLQVNQKNNNKGGGYLTIGSDSIILGGIHHIYNICSDVLDRLNSTQFEYNIPLMKLFRNSWSSMNKPKLADGIDRLKDETKEEYQNRLEAFADYEKLVYATASQLINNGNKFYLTHKYDKRGRIYCIGYQCSYQSNSYGKAILNFANKELVSNTIEFF